jgi:hypothetical protein
VVISKVAWWLLALPAFVFAQDVHVHKASPVDMPGPVDSNSPAWWQDGQLHLLNSTGNGPLRSIGSDQFHLGTAQAIQFTHTNPWPTWIEATWRDPDSGIIFAWYHQEHWGVCGSASRLAVPQIGAAVSWDNGKSFQDMGEIISSGDLTNCAAQNGYFAGGTGDFSVMLAPDHSYFYFFFTNYNGPVESQGVAVARVGFYNRFGQHGGVMKYYNGDWTEPGIGGRVTPIFRAKVSWMAANTDSFWGPSIHWNTYLQEYVMLLNRSCCTPGFTPDGIWVTYGTDLSDPKSWSKPKKILSNVSWYPQVLAQSSTGTDSLAGRTPRLYVYGHSEWTLEFVKPAPPATP